jgi:hypothetical protein
VLGPLPAFLTTRGMTMKLELLQEGKQTVSTYEGKSLIDCIKQIPEDVEILSPAIFGDIRDGYAKILVIFGEKNAD